MSSFKNQGDWSLIKGQSIQIHGLHKEITPKQSHFLNEFFLDEIQKCPLFKIVAEIRIEPTVHICTDNESFKIYLGRQLGERVFEPTYDERSGKVINTAQAKAMRAITNELGLYGLMAEKWFNLALDGYFEQYRNEELPEYWARRIGVDISTLSNIRDLLPDHLLTQKTEQREMANAE